MFDATLKYLVLAVVFFCVVQTSTAMNCTVPGPNHKPLTVEDRIQKAPIVVRGYLVRKIGNGSIYQACLFITHVYKGYLSSSYICVDNFGVRNANTSNTTVNCLSDLSFDVEYLILLEKTGKGYRARYDDNGGAAVPYNDDIIDDIKDALCCPTKLGKCDSGKVICRRGYRCGLRTCFCSGGYRRRYRIFGFPRRRYLH